MKNMNPSELSHPRCRPAIPPAWNRSPLRFAAQERHVPLRWAHLYRPPGSDDPWAARPDGLGAHPLIGRFRAVSTQTP